MDYKKTAAAIKAYSFKMASLSRKTRDLALQAMIDTLSAHKDEIFAANEEDLKQAALDQLPMPIQNRLKFDDHKLSDCISGMKDLIAMEDPLFQELLKRKLDDDLTLIKTTCPIGVIGVIFESRPDALVQISSLCVKSGNCAILKGGSEAARTNRILFDLLYKAVPIVIDSKTQYAAACNAAETLLVHRAAADDFLPALAEAAGSSIEFRGDTVSQALMACAPAKDSDFETEYLDTILSVKIVDSLQDAVDHINHYGSHHTDCIITENPETAQRFMSDVDSAGVYQNCSTRFADGFRYGFGAEVGISTGKLHARGPVGLDGLVTYKYKLFGNGQIVSDYASGARSFKFEDIK